MFGRLKSMNLSKVLFAFRINWAAILAFAAFWVYGFFGALSSGGWLKNFILFPILFGIFMLFLFFWQKKTDIFEDFFAVSVRDVFAGLLLLAALFPISFSALTNSVVNDGLAHAQQAESHGMNLIYILSGKFAWLGDISFSALLWVVSLITAAAGILFYRFLRNKKLVYKIIGYALVFILFREMIILLGGSGGPHPPFRLFPLWLSGAIFSPSDFAFRFAQFAALLGLGFMAYRFAVKKIGFLNSILFGIAAATIPVVWHVGILVEQSVWATLAWSFTLLYLFSKDDLSAQDHLRLFSVIAILTLVRQTAFVAFVPAFIRLGSDFWKSKTARKDLFVAMSPALVAAPFLLGSFIGGTSASFVSGGESFLPTGLSALGRVWFALKSGIAWTAITNSVQPIWIIFAAFAFVFYTIKTKRFLEIISLFLGGILIFYLILPDLWGIGRYQAEYIAPFAILGIFAVLVFSSERVSVSRYALSLGLLVLITNNIYVFNRIPADNLRIDSLAGEFTAVIKKPGEYSILSEFPYDYGRALTEAKNDGYASSAYIAGSTYGVFPQILAGFSVREVRAARNLSAGEDELRNGFPMLSPGEIVSDKRINLVLVSDVPGKEVYINKLVYSSWKIWKTFENREYGSAVVGLIRN